MWLDKEMSSFTFFHSPIGLPGVPYFVQAYEDHYPGFADGIITINSKFCT